MTLNELRNDVARLGFESYIDDEEVFLASANRALSLIYTDRPVSKTVTVPVSAPSVALSKALVEHHANEVLEYEVDGAGLYFVARGVGVCSVITGDTTEQIELLGGEMTVKRILAGKSIISFTGPYYFTVSKLTVFKELLSADATEIPDYSTTRVINPEDYCSDFRAFATEARNTEGEAIASVALRDGRIYVPFDYKGEIILTYYRAPGAIIGDTDNELIDLPLECSALLPLLTASFMWLDDDAAKAQYYMSLYRDLMAGIKRFSSNQVDSRYRTNGWA